MIKDHEGFMWFGTWDGINRFDGHNFTVYKSRPGDTSSLRNNRIDEIVEDKGGYLWLKAYDNSIYRFDKRTEQFLLIGGVSTESGKPVYNKIVLTHTGQMWLLTKNQGAYFIASPDVPHPQCVRFASGLAQSFSLPSNTINFFYEDQNSDIWVSTSNGICCLKKQTSGNYTSTIPNPAFTKGMNFTCIEGKGDKVWLGTDNGNLVCFENKLSRFFAKKVSKYRLNGLVVSKKTADIYLTTAGGEVVTVNQTNLSANISAISDAGQLRYIYEDKAGRLWIEPERSGAVKFDPHSKTFKIFNQKRDAYYDRYFRFFRIFEGNDDRVWVSMESGGFGYYEPDTDTINYFYDEPGAEGSRFSNIIICAYLDPAGIMWLNADDKGLNKIIFERNDFNQKLLVEHTISRTDNEIRGICYDREKRLWLASKSCKIYVIRNDKPVAISFTNQQPGGLGIVYSIIQDKDGNMWMGTKGNGLFKATPVNKERTIFKLNHFLRDESDIYSISSNIIYALYQDKGGRIWVGTYENGLNLVEQHGDQVKFINTNNSFKNYPKGAFVKIRHLQEDAGGELWIATTDGLLVLDPASYRLATFSKISGDKTSLSKNDIQYIYRDSKNNMWLSTSGGGLNKAIGVNPFKHLKFKVYTTEDGLPSDYIVSSVEDNNGYLWLASENGLSKFDPKNGTFRNYDSYDGLAKTGFSEASNIKLPNGDLIFGCISGYVSFNPKTIADHKISAKMVLTNFQVNNRDITVDGTLLKSNINNTSNVTLAYNQNILGIDYTVLDYRSGKQSYQYRLTGFDNVWRDNQSQRRVTYTNLPPGDYKFEVRSSNSALYSNVPDKSLSITILPPPWRTWWAYLLYVVTSAILIEIARRITLTMLKLRQRIEVEQKLADLKLTFFTNVSHELRTPLTLILNPIEEISKKETLSQQGNEHINVVRKNARRMVRFINQLLDLRKVQSGKATLKVSRVEIVSFTKKISEYFIDAAREKQIDLQIDGDSDGIDAWVDAEKLDIVIYNLLANAFKFTPNNKRITIAISQNTMLGYLSITISDQGNGVAENKLKDIFELYYEGDHGDATNLKGTGIGLALSKELIELHYGKITAKNNADRGLSVTIELKLGKEHFLGAEVEFIDMPQVPHQFEETVEDMLFQTVHVTNDHNSKVPLVLLVEDNNDLRTFLATQLNEHYRVEQAENGEEGLKKAMMLLPDLILSDVMMPKMDGIQMLDRLKNDVLTSHIPIVLLSAKFSVESQIEGLKYGADYYITKPFQNDFLLASIENLIKQRKRIFETFLNGKKTIELSPGEIVITSHDEVFLKKVITIVEERMVDPDFNIDAVAVQLNMGRSTFYKKFKSLTNIPPVEFVRDMRVKRAKQLLDAGENNIADVAYAVGFNTPKYFSTCFKEHYSLSPTEYLKTKTSKV
jgi:signal transduction histidine kinase/ligand-binding sensor domain-containing protein/DNA-binding response OmpR family regulator